MKINRDKLHVITFKIVVNVGAALTLIAEDYCIVSCISPIIIAILLHLFIVRMS